MAGFVVLCLAGILVHSRNLAIAIVAALLFINLLDPLLGLFVQGM